MNGNTTRIDRTAIKLTKYDLQRNLLHSSVRFYISSQDKKPWESKLIG